MFIRHGDKLETRAIQPVSVSPLSHGAPIVVDVYERVHRSGGNAYSKVMSYKKTIHWTSLNILRSRTHTYFELEELSID